MKQVNMAKKKLPTQPSDARSRRVKLTPRDKKTMAQHRRPGRPRGRLRPKSARIRTSRSPRARCRTCSYKPRKRIIEMGNATNRRQLFNLSQAKAYMQTHARRPAAASS